MEEENEILGPQQAWSPEMLFIPSVEEEEEEEVIEDPFGLRSSTKILSGDIIGISDMKDSIQEPSLSDLQETVKIGKEQEERKKKWEKYTSIASPNEIISDDNYDYKYDENGVYYYKPKDDEEWKTYTNKNSEGNLSIAGKFDHFDYDKYKEIKIHNEKVEKLAQDINKKNYYGEESLINEDKVNAIRRNLNPVEIDEHVVSVENVGKLANYINNLSEEDIQEPEMSYADILAGGFLVNIPLGLENAWESTKASTIDIIDKIAGLSGAPSVLTDFLLTGDISEVAFVDPETNETILLSENPGKWNELNKLKNSGVDIKAFYVDSKDKVGEATDRFLLEQFKKSKNLQNRRIDLGEIVKEFDITKPSDIKFSTGKELVGGIVNAFSGLLETAIPAALTRGYSLLPQIGAPMYVDYNIEKANNLYGEYNDPLSELIKRNETEVETPLILGAMATGLEYIGLKGIANRILNKTGSFAPFVSLMLTQNKEGLTEVGQLGIEDFNTSMAKGISLNEAVLSSLQKMASKDGLESYLMGVIAAGGLAAPSTFSQAVLTSGNNLTQVENYIDQINNLQLKKSQSNNTAFRRAMDVEIQSVEENFQNFLNETTNVTNSFTAEEKNQVNGFLDKKRENNLNIKDLDNSYTLGEINLNEYRIAKAALVNNNKGLSNKINKIFQERKKILEKAEKERAETVGMSILPTRRTTPKVDELALQYQENPAEVDVEALLDQYNRIGLAAIRFDTRKGDIAREDAVAEINKEFAGIMERWSPDQGAFSTFVTANIAPKAQSIYDKYVGKKDATTLDRQEAREVVAEEVDVEVEPVDTSRPKVYPASLEVITENITPEVRSEQTVKIKDDINRAVATESTSPKVVAKSIVKQTQTPAYRKLIKDKLGKWNSEQYNNNVDRLVTKEFIATIPIAQIKRRFGKLFNIEQTGTTPTTKIENGKRTDFKKPVYKIPAITDTQLEAVKDYFKETEKRQQSLYSLLGEGIAVEQIQELKADQQFMTDLQGRLELRDSDLTAEQFLNEVEFNLDKRNLEDTSLDVVEDTVEDVINNRITEENINDIEADVLSEAISRLETFRKTNLSMNALTGIVEAGLRTLRAAKNAGTPFVSAIKDFVKKIKDFIKKPTTRKTTPKKPKPKKPVSKKEKLSFKDFQRIFLIVKDNPKTLLRKKGYKTYPEQKGIWSNSFSAEQKLQRKEAVTRLMPELGLDFFNSYSWFKSERSIYKNKAEFNKEIFNDPLDADFVINNQEFIKKYSKKKGNQYFLDKNKIPQEGPALTTAEWNVFKKARTEQATYAKMSPSKRISLLNSKKFRDIQDKKIKVLEKIVKTINKDVRDGDGNIITERLEFWGAWIESQSNVLTHDFRVLAPIKFFSLSTIPFETQLRNGKKIKNYEAEHLLPVNNAARAILDMIINNSVDKDFVFIKDYYVQGQLLKSDDTIITKAGYRSKLPRDFFDMDKPNSWIRYLLGNPNINLNSYVTFKNGKVMTIAESVGLPLTKTNQTPDNIFAQNNLLIKVFTGALDEAGNTWTMAKARKVLKSAEPTNNLSSKQVNNNKENLFNLIKENSTTEQSIIDMSNADQAAQIARDINAPTKGISVFDFDDTLAYSNSKVIVNMPDGKVKKITPAEFAVQSESLLEQGAEFDFSEFNKVVKGRKGPLADLALKRQEKFGSGDIFVLTARPQASATSIKAFLDGIGLNIPLKNITGLEDGSPNAKALWILDKAARGYNDFYFADDALPNVQAVKNILDQIDVKSDVQQAKQNKPRDLNKEFNVIIEQQSGKEWFKTYSEARAKVQGRAKNRFEFLIPPSAEDFMGLMYKVVPKGRDGDRALVWIKENLLNPYNKAEQEVIAAKISVANDFNELRNSIDNIPDNLQKQAGYSNFTWSQALRVYMWNIQNMDIPGLSTRDNNALVKIIEDNADMKVFAEKITFIQKNKEYPAPGANWVGGSITSDIINSIQKTYRKEALAEWQQNVDIIFSETNMNKLEALYGSNYVVALNNILNRMKRGNNRPVSSSKQVENVIDWLNNSVGTIMFLNRKSALLQLISSVNFINWSDNNIAAAGRAFANQPQYWKDVMYLMNSDYLVQRRNGMRINVAESEIADASKKGGLKGVIAYLLNKGFIFTRIADSLAIATGGATFYRNRVNSLQKQVNIDTGKLYTKQEADTKAFDDFYQISEESQQSSRADRISMQQASGLGRLVLNFANTPMQYARIIKKSTKDLLAGRGDWKTNLSKIIYYGAVQNLIFSGLQAALFTILFDEEEKKDRTVSDKAENIGFNMLSSLLRGLGYGGALVDTIIAVSREIAEQQGKKSSDYEEAVWNVFDFSPAIDSKVRKLRSAANTFKFNRKEIARRGFNLENPAYLALGQVVSSTLNIPLDRTLRMAMTLKQASDQDIALWQRIALIAGYSSWSVNLPYWGTTTTIEREAQEDEEIKVKYKKDTEKLKDKGFKRIPMTKGKPSGELGKDFITVTRPSGSIEYWLMPKK